MKKYPKQLFREVKTGAIFWYRGIRYMKCCNSYDKYDDEPNTFTHPKKYAKPRYTHFKNSTSVFIEQDRW